jgi:SAM-dependent methyltransferase
MQIVTACKSPILYLRYKSDFNKFKELSGKKKARFKIDWSERYPILNENTKTTHFDRHYIYHTAWAVRAVKKIDPEFHIDISSTLYFSITVSAFIPVRFYDYRPANLHLDNLKEARADLVDLPFEDNSVRSLSCMHTIEHVGLGRYGDKLDPDGDLKAIAELKRVLAPGGNLLFVVPIGKPKIMFNAHRIYSYEQILSYFKGLHLKEYALIPDKESTGGLMINASKEITDSQEYACGCFWFVKE